MSSPSHHPTEESFTKIFTFDISKNHHDENTNKHPLKRRHNSGYTQDEYYLPSLIYDVWQTFYRSKNIHWILWPCFIKHDVDIILTCPGLETIIPCHFKVLRQLIPFFSDFGTFDDSRLNGVDEPVDEYNQHFVATSPQIHAHNPFRPPTHVMFTELNSIEDGQALISIITLCYTNSLQITDQNVVSLYKVANLLHMKNLCKSCVTEMSKEITLDNAVKYWNAADGNESVCSSVVDDLADITEISKNLCSTQFRNLTTEQIITLNLEQLKFLLMKEDLGVDNEDQVFTLVIKWLEINAHVMRRSEPDSLIHNMALELIPLVRLPQCSFSKLVELEKFAQKTEFNMDYENDRKLMKLALLAQRIRIALQEKENKELKEKMAREKEAKERKAAERNERKQKHKNKQTTKSQNQYEQMKNDPSNYEKKNNKIQCRITKNSAPPIPNRSYEFDSDNTDSLLGSNKIDTEFRDQLPAFLSTIDALDLDDWSFIDTWVTKRTSLFGV